MSVTAVDEVVLEVRQMLRGVRCRRLALFIPLLPQWGRFDWGCFGV